MDTLPPSALDEANTRAVNFGRQLPDLARADLAAADRRLSSTSDRRPEYVEKLQGERDKAARAVDLMKGVTGIDTSIEGMTRNVRRIVSGEVNHARSRTRFNEQNGTPKMELPAGFDFYSQHGGAYQTIGKREFGGGEEGKELTRRLTLVGTGFSAGAMPQVELQGSAGLARVHNAGADMGVEIDHHTAEYLNSQTSKMGATIEPGKHSLADLDPVHAALVTRTISRRARGAEDHPALSRIKLSDEAHEQSHAADALVGGAGTSGVRSIARGLDIMRDPAAWSDPPASAGAWKVPSYSSTTALHNDPKIGQALEHMVGAAVHGEKWWAAHPGSEELVRAYQGHPAITNPLVTSDIHNARALITGKGMSYEMASALGDRVRPETMFTAPQGMESDVPSGRPKGIQKADLGYMAQEHATRGAGLSYSLGGRKYSVPVHAIQAMAWYGQQAKDPRRASGVASGAYSRIHSEVQADPTKSLNPIHVPRL